ncbi:MAG TPA: helix-turn-helix transcriptional regulator, partial [Haloplasmataceae bacterium]
NKEYEFTNLIAENLIYYRKANNLTQLQLAEKLNYSDKSISKWERGEGLPDIFVLHTICELFGITLNDLTRKKKVKVRTHTRSRAFVTLVSIGICWFIAIIAFVLLKILIPRFTYSWLAFIYAIPISAIILIVFSGLWWNRIIMFLSTSVLTWTIPLSIYLSIHYNNIWMLFYCAIPIQIILILWFILRYDHKKKNL